MSEFVNAFMNEIIVALMFFPPAASVVFIVAITRPRKCKVNSR